MNEENNAQYVKKKVNLFLTYQYYPNTVVVVVVVEFRQVKYVGVNALKDYLREILIHHYVSYVMPEH